MGSRHVYVQPQWAAQAFSCSRSWKQAGQPCLQGRRQSATGSCCHNSSLQRRGLSLRHLRKPRVGFQFRDSCFLERLHICGRTRAPFPLSPFAVKTPWRSGFTLQGPYAWSWGILPSPTQKFSMLLPPPLHSFLMTPMAVLWSQDLQLYSQAFFPYPNPRKKWSSGKCNDYSLLFSASGLTVPT